jgi:NAD(P)-dependent dehydrogenase (short-subunit alcohol dehydrogenase family)
MESTVLIIGASRGLGAAIAAEYLERGFRVVATVRGSKRTPLHELKDGRSDDRLEIEELTLRSMTRSERCAGASMAAASTCCS